MSFYTFLRSQGIQIFAQEIDASEIIESRIRDNNRLGGSTGAEALIKGKKLLNFGGAYYVGILPNERFSLLIVIQIRMSSLVKAPKTHVELFLKNTIKGKYDFLIGVKAVLILKTGRSLKKS